MITIEPSFEAVLSTYALTRFLNRARRSVGLCGEVDVLLANDRTLRKLNRSFRGKDKPTDVLSFPAPTAFADKHAGDLAISLETAARYAKIYGHDLFDETKILVLHGLLHLAGEDHETDDGQMATREANLRDQLHLPSTLIERSTSPVKKSGITAKKRLPKAVKKGQKITARWWMTATYAYAIALFFLLVILALSAYVDRIYFEMGKFLSREYQDNIDAWEEVIEPRLRLGRESIALSASVLRQLTLATLALLAGLRLYTHSTLVPSLASTPSAGQVIRAGCELVLLILIFDRLLPQLLFSRTRGTWIARILPILQTLFYLILPVTMLLQLLLSIAALAEPEDRPEEDHPSEAMDALLEAGEEEGILEESDRELVRSAVEFGDKVVLEVMTPRPEIFSVSGALTLREFTAQINEHNFSRVPVYSSSLDHITGIAFAHDLLKVLDTEANTRTVDEIQRPAAFVPETKRVAELLREMQREKQHMRIVIDEYGSVAGLVTIEDLLEAIVGNIADEHDQTEADDSPIREPNGAYTVSGSFELSRLRDLFADQLEASRTEGGEVGQPHPADSPESYDLHENRGDDGALREEANLLRLPTQYESTTLGGLVSELAGHIPLPGEVVEQDGLRLEVLASTDRRIDRIRVSLSSPPALS